MMTKKNYHVFLSLLMMLFFSVGMASCSDKDKEGSLEAPKYEKDAAKFTITSEDSPYSSIELTASGNYLITEKGYNPYYKPGASLTRAGKERTHSNIFAPKTEIGTRDSYGGIIYGKYTKNANGDYVLEGFGTIKVESNGGTSVDLEITTLSGENIVVGANRDNIMTESDKTNKLCRTWKFTKVRLAFWEEGKKVFDKTMSWNEYLKWGDDGEGLDEDYDEIPENVIFTKAGTYLVTYTNGELAVSTWRWVDESKGLLRYSWDYDDIYDEDESGIVEVKFDGDQLVIIEDYEDEEYGEREYIEWYLSED